MAWIDMVDQENTDGKLAKLYGESLHLNKIFIWSFLFKVIFILPVKKIRNQQNLLKIVKLPVN
jgi:hypothetical protein